MKKFVILILASIAVILLSHFQALAQNKNRGEMEIVVSEASLSDFIQDLLPYQCDFGKKFSGSFEVQSVDHIEILKDTVKFDTRISGENVKYSVKIINKPVNVSVGTVNLRNKWEVSLWYDKKEKILFATPYVKGVMDEGNVNKGEMLLHALLEGLSGVGYPLKLNDLKPVKLAMNKKDLLINVDITDICAERGKLIVTMKPSARYNGTGNSQNR